MTNDKRKFLRFDVGLNADINSEEGIAPIPAPIKDVSKEGLRLSTQHSIPKGNRIKLEITLPGELVPIFVEGKVAWSQPANEVWKKEHDCGIQFLNIDPFDRSRLLDFAYDKWLHVQRG